MAKSRSKTDFDAWVRQTKGLDAGLDEATYKTLAEPNVQERPLAYSLKDVDLYDKIIMKYMMPPAKNNGSHEADHDMHMDHAHMEGM
ncbi:cytochrome o ubiquinol oxidase subunit II [compost metagenome]